MADKHILHMLSPLKHVSPFDVNMALDAGFDAVVPYEAVEAHDVTGLVQDAIFSRPPKLGPRTGIFIGGRNAIAALDMIEAAKQAMVPPFAASIFADPAGSFTTAAAMVARVERVLKQQGHHLRDSRVVIFGATGVVGFASGVIAALEGARVTLAGHDGPKRVAQSAEEIGKRFKVTMHAADASSEERKGAVLREAEIALCAGKAGVQILSTALLRGAPGLRVVADVNAVPPLGVEGLDVHADGPPVGNGGPAGIGALAIGQTKYRTEFGLFRRMIESDKPVAFDFRDAFALARELAA
ncbi:MAG TPA: NAD(P)-dependent methylenetetrahydromethanopterin dehydrogenase [Acetobacteraceae bacterium]|nr:NAD(P)-dependent methylenetetrahydromethanopterin dehydrogenase [Acetobacteraceae bacterium]